MLKHVQFFLIIISILLFGSCLISIKGYAEENDTVGFTVSPNYNQAQQNNSSFFDLVVTPGSKHTISVTVSNTSHETSNYDIQVIQASTNKNGVIDYSDNKGLLSKSLPVNLKEQAKYEKKIQLPAGESKEVPISLSIPSTSFEGEVLGGINVSKEVTKKSTSQLVNQYSYILGLRLRENKENIKRVLTAGDVVPEVIFGKPGVRIPIINDKAIAMGHLQINSTLRRSGKEIKTSQYKEREIAPNSIYPYTFTWDEKDYLPGKYELTISIKDAQMNRWTFKKNFILSGNQVTKVKNATIYSNKPSQSWLWLIVVIAFLLILGLLIYITRIRKETKKEGQDE